MELAKDWRTDRILRRLEAMLIVLDKDDDVPAVGQWRSDRARRWHRRDRVRADRTRSPRPEALAGNTDLDARAIAEKAMAIAGEICIYTNATIVLEEL